MGLELAVYHCSLDSASWPTIAHLKHVVCGFCYLLAVNSLENVY